MTVSATTAATPATKAATGTAAAATSANALTTLSGNFNDFLSLLTTQLKNQDPTSPMDTSKFTSELVQFTGVEQQINTNASLTSLIQATQGTEVIQATAITGKPVVVNSPNLALQDGSASINFTVPGAEPVTITLSSSAGTVLKTAHVNAASGANTWSWDGATDSGARAPDGAYAVSVKAATAAGGTGTLPFTVNGTATGVTNNNGTVTLNIGALAVGFTDVVSVGQ